MHEIIQSLHEITNYITLHHRTKRDMDFMEYTILLSESLVNISCYESIACTNIRMRLEHVLFVPKRLKENP